MNNVIDTAVEDGQAELTKKLEKSQKLAEEERRQKEESQKREEDERSHKEEIRNDEIDDYTIPYHNLLGSNADGRLSLRWHHPHERGMDH